MTKSLSAVAGILLLSSIALSQAAEKPPAFESADVHVSVPSSFASMSGGVPRDGRYELRAATMLDLIRTAYGVTDDKVVGGPGWLSSERFDVIAKMPHGAPPETAALMLRTLLAERFDLKAHNDNRPLPVFVLTGGRNRSKMKPSDGSQNGCQSQPQAAAQPGVIPYNEVSCHNLTGAAIAEALRQIAGGYLDRPVLDKTNLEGSWDFTLKWTSRGQLAAAGADGISIFDAVDKQLGLKLESQRVPMPVIVVDRVNRQPSRNPPALAETLPQEKPEFEAAEIKLSPPGSRGDSIRYTQGGRVDARGMLRELIAISYEILPSIAADSIVGPKFIETTHFTIVAKTPSSGIGAPARVDGREVAPPLSVAMMMLRSMLEDRFKLKAHREDRPASSYALVAKGETKLKKAEASDRAGCKADPGAIPTSPNGVSLVAVTCQNTTMAELIQNLPRLGNGYIDHPVVDHTGLPGGWNFTMIWTPSAALDNRPSNAPPGVASDPGSVSIFEAVERLGLKLEKGTNTIPVIVIDHVEEQPVD